MASASELVRALAAQHLAILGVCPPDPAFCPPGKRGLALIGPGSGAWWHHVTASPEWQDGRPDPIDRLSKRLLTGLAEQHGGRALFPSDGPPWPPFFRWAQATGQMWQSPVGMLVHARAGLWVSFRGALALPFPLDLPVAENPCTTCATKPCTTACPVGALSPTRYDTDACHAHLDTQAGQSCLTGGCAARAACPVSQSHGRLAVQSAYHMSRFHR